MKVLNPNKIPSRIILNKKMVVENSDEENYLIEQQVKEHNKRFNDNLQFFKTKKMTFEYSFNNNTSTIQRGVIPDRYKVTINR